jgi:hypothetical protein
VQIKRKQLRKARPENVRRLARWLRVRNLDEMSDRQVISFLHWLFTRREKRERGLIL